MNSRPQAGRNRRRMAGLVVAGLVFATSAVQASGIPVVDGVHLGISKLAWIEQYAQKAQELSRQIEQLQTQIKQYEQMQLNAGSFVSVTGLREDLDLTFPERDVNEGVADKCGPRAPSSGTNLDARMKQYTLCVRIVQTENRRFNVMRGVLDDIREKDKVIQKLVEKRNALGPDDFGRITVINTDIAMLEAQQQIDLQNAQTTLSAYNTFLQGLQEENLRVAETVLKGSSGNGGVVGEIASYGTLKLALQVARQRDR